MTWEVYKSQRGGMKTVSAAHQHKFKNVEIITGAYGDGKVNIHAKMHFTDSQWADIVSRARELEKK